MNTKFINAILKKIINEDNELYVKKILKPEILLIFAQVSIAALSLKRFQN